MCEGGVLSACWHRITIGVHLMGEASFEEVVNNAVKSVVE